MPKHTYQQRQYIKQLIIESEVQRFQLKEALAYIKAKSGIDLPNETYYSWRRIIKTGSLKRLNEYQYSRYAYLYEYFNRIEEIRKYQKELWETIHLNQNDGYLKKSCISELHQLTITLTNLYEMLPEYSSSLATRTSTTTENGSGSQQEEETTRPVF